MNICKTKAMYNLLVKKKKDNTLDTDNLKLNPV